MTDISQTVVHGDAFEELADLEEASAHAAVIDYPWQFDIQTGTGQFEHRNKPRGTGQNDRDLEADQRMFDMVDDDRVDEVADELARILVDGAWTVWFADDRFQRVVRNALRDHDEWILRRNWAWTPKCMGMGAYGRVSHYPIPVATLGKTDRYVRDRGTLFEIPGGREVDYPTGKPAQLYRELLQPPVVHDDERLLEPFCGSAPGATVANERGLDYWGCDVDVDAVEQARDTFAQTTATDWYGGESSAD